MPVAGRLLLKTDRTPIGRDERTGTEFARELASTEKMRRASGCHKEAGAGRAQHCWLASHGSFVLSIRYTVGASRRNGDGMERDYVMTVRFLEESAIQEMPGAGNCACFRLPGHFKSAPSRRSIPWWHSLLDIIGCCGKRHPRATELSAGMPWIQVFDRSDY